MRVKINRFFFLLCILLLQLSLYSQDFRSSAERDAFMLNKINEVKNNKTLTDTEIINTDGELVKLSDLAENYLVINFWTTWSLDGRAESPYFEAMKTKFAETPINFISISVEEYYKEWVDYVDEHPVNFDQYWLGDGHANPPYWLTFEKVEMGNRKMIASTVPQYVVLDSNLRIIENRAPKPSNRKLDELLRSLLEEK